MDNQNGFLSIKDTDLDKILSDQTKTLVGIICKRFEILDSKEDIKKETKELIYENARVLKRLIESYSKGFCTKFEFQTRKSSSTQ